MDGHKIITEGDASIVFPEGNKVFYNKAQVVNRDMSIAVLNTFCVLREKEWNEKQQKMQEKRKAKQKNGEVLTEEITSEFGLTIFEALSASGLRSMRYFKEIPKIRKIIVNDLDPAAVESIKKNIEFNKLPTDKVIANLADASEFMFGHRKYGSQFDVVDLDPYGSAVPFLDTAIQSVADGGLLCVTCTDKSILCGNNPETCFSKYGSIPLRADYCHEMAVRIVLRSIESTANRYKRHIVPMASFSIDFYCRVFVRVYTSPREVKNSACKLGYVFQCVGCESYHINPLAKSKPSGKKGTNLKYTPSSLNVGQKCTDCGHPFHIGGPIYIAPMHDKEFLNLTLKHATSNGNYAAREKIVGLLTTASQELEDSPLFFSVPDMSQTLHVSTPPFAMIRSAVVNAGYRMSQSHTSPKALKTDAPTHIVWDIFRQWALNHPSKPLKPTQPGWAITQKKPSLKVDFTLVKEARLIKSKNATVKKFKPNPDKNWGPLSRANGKKRKGDELLTVEEQMAAKRKRNQGKNQKTCNQFQKNGTCSYGDSCRFSHVESKIDESL